jgi:hypothetical protein
MMTNIIGIDPEPDLLQLDMELALTFVKRGAVRLPVFQPAETVAA